MLKRLLDWIIPDHALQVGGVNEPLRLTVKLSDEEAAAVEASHAEWMRNPVYADAYTELITADTMAAVRATETAVEDFRGACREHVRHNVPCTCNPRFDPENDRVDPNCWACNRGH